MDLYLLLLPLVALGALGVLIKLKKFLKDSRTLSGVPWAPGGNWLLGHVIPLSQRKEPWHLMKEWVEDCKEPIVRFRILDTHGVVVRNPESMLRIFQTHYKSYPKDLEFSYKPFLCILGTGLVTSEGRLWQDQRLLMTPALRVDILSEVVPVAKKAADRLSEKLEKFRGTGISVDLQEEFRLLTLQVIGDAILTLPPHECDKVFPQLYLPAMEESNIRTMKRWRMYLPTPDWFRQHYRIWQLDKYIITLLRLRWKNLQAGNSAEKADILDRILRSIEEKGVQWNSALETQLCFEIKTFLLAGHETSAAMLSWAMFELTQNPECMNKVLKEAEAVFGPQDDLPDRSAVDGMRYTLSVLKETLRKYTVVPTVTRRVGVEEESLCGYKIPKQCMVVLSLQAVHNTYKSPQTFNPDRFMPGGEYEQFDEAIRPFMFLPFVQGPRNCLGQHFALLESRIVLSLLVKRFKFLPTSSGCPEKSHTIPECLRDGLNVLIE